MSVYVRKLLLAKLRKLRTVPGDKVINAFIKVPRENFVVSKFTTDAYEDNPLAIGYRQTISQPSTVFTMVEALEIKKTDHVLEVGTGSGYQAAILSQLSDHVSSVEIIPELVDFAKKNLIKSDINNVKVICWDGSVGYEPAAPYDKIIIAAANDEIPEALIKQLKEGGVLIAPIGGVTSQKMIKATIHDNKITQTYLGQYIFVPLTGKYGRKM